MSYYPAPADEAPFNNVVEITLLTTSGTAAQATGIVIAPNYVLTAAHVTDDATAIQVDTPDAIDGSSTDAASQWTSLSDYSGLNTLTYSQSATDLGIIQLSDPTSAPPRRSKPALVEAM